ncbi:MAG: hypothetical protein NWR72_14350 [Bacteroidia bacterium]|nr:hypothetical protein [Bacteroidia bacterium]
MKQIPSLLFLGLLFFGTSLIAQTSSKPNYSLQVGGQFRFLNPVGLNHAIDQFNLSHPSWTDELETIGWTQGLSFAAGIHRGRSEIRFQVQTFGASGFGIGPDSLGISERLDTRLSGVTYQVALASNLVEINRNLTFGIGGAFSMNQITLRSAFVPESEFNADAELPETQTFLKPSLNLIAPINIGLGPWVNLKIEPTYQVFFAPSNYSDFSQAINGSLLSVNDPALETEADHFGITVSLVAFFRRKYK